MARAGGQHIVRFEQAADARFADRDGAQHQGAVRHRLVAGNADSPFEALGLARNQGLEVAGQGGDFLWVCGELAPPNTAAIFLSPLVLTSPAPRGMGAANPNIKPVPEGLTVVKAELGTKRTCPSCAARFYDLLKNPIVCPKCGVTFIAATLLPSKSDMPAAAAQAAARSRQGSRRRTAEVELVSLEEVEEPGQDDETAAIEDVDLGEEAEDAEGEEADAFLEEEEEDGGDVAGLLDSGPTPGGKEDEEEV